MNCYNFQMSQNHEEVVQFIEGLFSRPIIVLWSTVAAPINIICKCQKIGWLGSWAMISITNSFSK